MAELKRVRPPFSGKFWWVLGGGAKKGERKVEGIINFTFSHIRSVKDNKFLSHRSLFIQDNVNQ